jgi:hypothetical protein
MTQPGRDGWSPKDQLAHVEAWERWCLQHLLQGRPEHETVGLGEEEYRRLDEAGVNALMQARDRDRHASDILESLHRLHAEVVAALEALPSEDLLKQRYPNDPKQWTVLDWTVECTIDHYEEHRRAIESG